MVRWKLLGTTLAATAIAFAAGSVAAEEFSARLDGFQELGSLPNVNLTATPPTAANPTGAILSNGKGTLTLKLDEKAQPPKATWTLSYSDVGSAAPKTGTVTQAHIHFGKNHVSGGILVFF